MNATYVVVGCLGSETDHEFGEYDRFKMAFSVWASHDEIDGPVRIEKRSRLGDVLATWRGVNGDLTQDAE